MNKTIKKELILLKDLGYRFPTQKSKEKRRYGLYKCFCDKEFEAIVTNVNSNRTKSCGCLRGINHNLTSHRLYGIWHDMIRRCNNPKRRNYIYYGGRGIKVCNEWLDINRFIDDMYPSYVEGLTLDRIDVNGNYEKNNCRWENNNVQRRNTQLLRKDNTSGYRGVTWFKNYNKWCSSITVNSKNINLGYFKDKVEAAKAYDGYVINNKLEHTINFKKGN